MGRWIAGVDGCREGWVAAFRDLDEPGAVRVRVARRFAEVVDAPERPLAVAADVPIGLPERIAGPGRGPEQAVRPQLGPLKSAVFSIPSRAAVHAEPGPYPDEGARLAAFRRACAVARATSDPPRAFSIQAFGILPKVREVDALLLARPELRGRVFEAHPELAFRMLSGSPLATTKRSPEGEAARRRILRGAGIPEAALALAPPRGAKPDDLLDALALLPVAADLLAGRAVPFPDPPATDGRGLRVAIWTCAPRAHQLAP